MARRQYRCEFAQLIDAIPTPTRDPAGAAFKAASDDTDPWLLAQWLAQTGRRITARDINEHRRRECGCPTK